MPADYEVHVDWNADSDYSDASEDVTGRALDGRTAVTMRYGRDQSRALSPISPGEAGFELDNSDRRLSPENTASPLYGNVRPGRPVRIRATYSGSTYTLFTGHLDDFDLAPDPAEKSVKATCLDPLAKLRKVQVSTELYSGLRVGEAIAVVLDAAGWPAALRDLDVGASVLPWFWADADDAYTILTQLVDSEGPPALLTADVDGRIVFRDRHHRLQRAASLTAQSTWTSGGLEPSYSAMSYSHGWKEIVNVVEFDVPMRAPGGTRVPVWSTQGRTTIADGETLLLTARSSDPFLSASVPVEVTDYELVSGVVEMSLSRQSGMSTTVLIKAVGGPAVVENLQVRGYPLTTVTTVRVAVEDTASIEAHDGRQSMPSGHEPVWASVYDARAIAHVILAFRAERLPTAQVTFQGGSDVRLVQQLTRDLSDRVRVVDTETCLAADCFVEQISHTITEGGLDHRTVFGLEKAPTQIADVFVLGSATQGVLGTNRLGKRGLADPDTMFVLGSATNGVLGENVLVP